MEESAQAVAPLHVGGRAPRQWRLPQKPVVESLMVSLAMVVLDVLPREKAQVVLTEQDLCFANIPTVGDSPTQMFPTADRTKTASFRITLVPIAIGDAHRSHPRRRLPFARFERNESTFTALAVRRLQTIQSSAGPGRRSFACLCVREGDPEAKTLGVWPRHAHLTARIASPQASCPHEIE